MPLEPLILEHACSTCLAQACTHDTGGTTARLAPPPPPPHAAWRSVHGRIAAIVQHYIGSMTIEVQVLQEAAEAVSRASERQPRAAGLLVGLRDGSSTLVCSALHCEEEDLATTQGACAEAVPPPSAVQQLAQATQAAGDRR